MEIGCSLYALLACFNWSNFYVDGGLSFQDSSTPHQEWRTQVLASPSVVETIRAQYTTTRPLNPYGRLAFGYEMRFSAVTLALEAAHTSSFETNDDRGINTMSLKARWYPFRR